MMISLSNGECISVTLGLPDKGIFILIPQYNNELTNAQSAHKAHFSPSGLLAHFSYCKLVSSGKQIYLISYNHYIPLVLRATLHLQ